jgi:hypothetical protein
MKEKNNVEKKERTSTTVIGKVLSVLIFLE